MSPNWRILGVFLSCFFGNFMSWRYIRIIPIPNHTMHGIFAYIYHQNQPFMWVSIPIPMDAMGMTTAGLLPSGQLTSDSKKVPFPATMDSFPGYFYLLGSHMFFVSRENQWFSSVEPIRPDLLGESLAMNFTFWWSAEAINWNLTLPRMNEWIDLISA